MRREEHVDYHLVADEHLAVHERLTAWARWVRVRPQGWQTAPMFMQYRSKSWQWEVPLVRAAVNELEVVEMEKAVSKLPDKHRTAIRWQYVWCGGPAAMARHLAVTKQGLLELIREGRTMLKNRGA
jgi:DNA-directed RNA polymerase specialized sigma24 family protein